MTKKQSPKDLPFDLVAGVPLDLVTRLDRGAPPAEPIRDLLIVQYSERAGGKVVEVGRADGFAAALRLMIDSLGLEDGDPDKYFFLPPELAARVEKLHSAADREFLLLFATSFSVRRPADFEDDEYLTDTNVSFPDYAPVIGWSASGPMTDVAYAILERRGRATSLAAIVDERLTKRAAELTSRKKDARLHALHFLSRMEGVAVVRVVSGALRDRQYDVRVAAGEALARIGSESAFAALIAGLNEQPDDGAKAGIVRGGIAILPHLEPHLDDHGPAIAFCIGQIAEKIGRLDELSRAMVFAIAAQPGWRSHMAVIPVLASPMLPHLASARPLLERYRASLSPKVRELATSWIRLFDERDG